MYAAYLRWIKTFEGKKDFRCEIQKSHGKILK